MLKKLQFDDKTSKIRAVLIYVAAIVLDLVLAAKFAGNTSASSIIIFCVIVDVLFIFYAGVIFRAPVFGRKTVPMYKAVGNDQGNSEFTKAMDANFFSNYYGCSEAEGRLIAEQKATNALIEEQNRLLRERTETRDSDRI